MILKAQNAMQPEARQASPASHRRYMLALLTAILTFNYLDRQALGIVLQDIKTDLHLTDTQLGFLTGIAFAFFYSVMGIPIARWADRGNRVTLITLTTALWSVMVALCGAAGSFVQLLLIRVGVAVGEAGCTPPAFSLIADHFKRAERARASAIYGLGGPLSAVVGYFLAGSLNEAYGWRVTFVVLGLPGFFLAALAWFGLHESRNTNSLPRAAAAGEPADPASFATQPSLRETVVTLWANVTFRHLLMCLSIMFFFLYGILQWLPTFFIRSYGLEGTALGTAFALVIGSGSLLGSYLGGELASRYAGQDERLQLKGLSVFIVFTGVLSMAAYLSYDMRCTFALTGLSFMSLTLVNGPLFAMIQTLVPQRMRAVAFAFIYLCANLLGMGLGPLAAGALSDALHAWKGEESLRYALMSFSPGYLWVAWHAWRASRSVMHDMAAVPAESA